MSQRIFKPVLRAARRTAVVPAALLALFLLGGLPSPVRAHPADMYAQNLSLTLRGEGVLLEWQILPGPFLADAVWAAADLDQSGSISASEAGIWIEPFVTLLAAELDSQALQHDGVRDLHWPASVDVMRTGEDRIRFTMEFTLPPALHGLHALRFHAAHLEANSLIWFAVTAEDGVSFEQPSQTNGLLEIRARFGESADGITEWNSGMPNLGGFGAMVSQLASASANPSPGGLTEAGQGGGVTAALTNLVKTREFSPAFLGSSFLLSLLLGSLHALTPGHGKALVGAYLVGSQGRTRDAVFLGGIVTLTHTGSVVLLGVVTLLASHYILPALIAPWLEIISGVLVIGFGLNLLLRRGGDLMRWLRGGRDSAHPHDHDPGHSHSHSHVHPHTHGHPHTHDSDDALRPTAEGRPLPQITFRSLLALGISGGLVPCPDAIAILLVAVAVNRIPFGMLLILSFSIGLALVLIGIGIAMVKGVRLIARSEAVSRFAVYAPVVSAVVVTGLGAALTVTALRSLSFGTQVVRSAAEAQAGPVFDVTRARLLYVAADSTGWDQLFVKPLSGGEAVQYTSEETGVTGYTISPDRETILYTLFRLDGGTAIGALNADGSQSRIILDCPASECNSPRWYPDGSRIAYERLDDATEAVVPRFSIWWLDLASGDTRPLFQDAAFASQSPQFSPDGAWLSYVATADNTLILFHLEDSSTVTQPLGLQASLPAAWSPDSQHVLFGNQADESAPSRAKIYSLATAEITDLGGPEGASDYSAAWSPDGHMIAINRNVPLAAGQFGNQVWIVSQDGGDARVLLQEPGASYSSLAWAPDSKHLLYARYVLDLTSATPGRFDIYMTDVATGESQLLAQGGDMPMLLP